MEEGVFHHSAVADLLEHRFVEARLHVDYPDNARRQLEMVESNAQPIYVVLDPNDETLHSRYDGATLSSDDPFIEFLNFGWDSARPSTAASGAQ